MVTTVVNIRKADYDVYCGRAGKGQDGYFGNPFPLSKGESRGSTIKKFEEYFINMMKTDATYRQRIHQLTGKILGCFCKPRSCHCDVIASYLNHRQKVKENENIKN